MKKLLIITGPTGVGKTSISIKIAKELSSEIISCDSMQIYKKMDIGTAKATSEEMQGIPHHMIDIIEPEDSFSVAEYKDMAEAHINDISGRGKLPILVGGTGLYINSFLYNLDYNKVEADKEYREYLENIYDIDGAEVLYNMLIEVDREAENLLTKSDKKRIIRALEIYKHSGVKLSELRKNLYNPNPNYDVKLFFLHMDRELLYDRINRRVDIMVKNGLIDEVKQLYESGLDESYQSMHGIGYKQILSYFRGESDLETQIERIKQLSRNYAKRQYTWFRKESRAKWLDVNKLSIQQIKNTILDEVGR